MVPSRSWMPLLRNRESASSLRIRICSPKLSKVEQCNENRSTRNAIPSARPDDSVLCSGPERSSASDDNQQSAQRHARGQLFGSTHCNRWRAPLHLATDGGATACWTIGGWAEHHWCAHRTWYSEFHASGKRQRDTKGNGP